MLVRTELCIGCKVCTLACKDEFEGNSYGSYSVATPSTSVTYGPNFYPTPSASLSLVVQAGQEWISVQSKETGTYPNAKAKYIPTPCVQCDSAPCIAASTGGAVFTRPDKIVLIDPVKSASQKQIVASCPYNKIFWNDSAGIPQKCTFCAHLVDQGKNPKCVDSCPTTALIFGDLDDPNSAVAKGIASTNAQPLRPELNTKPKVYYTSQ